MTQPQVASTKALPLRDYQTEALKALRGALDTEENRQAIVMATGLGKTVIFSHLAKLYADRGDRVIILVHRDELVRQTIAKVETIAPSLHLGVVKAERNEVGAQVIVASIQTLAREARREQLNRVDLIIVDECHHATARSYVDTLIHLGAFDERRTPTVGFTATLARGDGEGLGTVWQNVAYRKDILWGILNKRLADVRGLSVHVPDLELDAVKRSRGDYQDGSLGDALMAADAGQYVAEAYAEHAGERPGIMFAPSVAAALHLAQAFNDHGIPTEVITGETPVAERQEIYGRFASGATQVLSSCMVLTEGFDQPHASCAVIARPTTSSALYIQMVGRVLRTFPGKTDALVLDVVGAAGRHRLASLVNLSQAKPTDGESLTEAVEREAATEQLDDELAELMSEEAGPLKLREINLFSRSQSAWLQTHKGVWFVPTQHQTFFLWPSRDEAGLYDVGRCSNRSTRDGVWLHKGATLELAMAWAESEAEDLDPSISRRSASWRQGNRRATDAQKGFADGLRITYTADVTKNDLSNLISIALASKLLDKTVR